MNDINKTILTGRLTKDSELKSTPTGTYLCRFDIAFNRSIKKDNGYEDQPNYISCIAWGKLAEYLSKTATKGRPVLVEGELQWSSWDNAEGKKQSKIELKVINIRFMDGKKTEQSNDTIKNEFNGTYAEGFTEPFNDDIPF